MSKMDCAFRHALVSVFDFVCLIGIAAVLSTAVPAMAYAYVDPSVMTYTIQAVAGVAVALSAVMGVFFRRTRKKLFEVLNIDENAGKIVDPKWYRVDEQGRVVDSAVDVGAAKVKRGRKKAKSDGKADVPSWMRRFALSLLVVAFCGFTLGIVAPFEIIAGSSESLMFGIADIWGVMVAFVSAVTLVVALLVSLVPGRAFTFVLTFVFCGGLGFYVQAMLLNTGLPIADGRAVDFWGDHLTMIAVSSIVWLVLLIAPPFVGLLNRARCQFVVASLSVCLIAVQAVGVVSLFAASSEDGMPQSAEGEVYVTEDGLFEVSKKDNVIVFVLDYFDIQLLDELMEKDPSILNGFDGFTNYQNHAGVMIPTDFAVPYLLTGEVPEEGESIEVFQEERYARSDFLEEANALNYSVGVYTPMTGMELMSQESARRELADNTINIHSQTQLSVDPCGAISQLVKCALYRDMPWVFKEHFLFYTDDLNNGVVERSLGSSPASTVYTLNDPVFLDRLESFGLSFEEDGCNGAFRFIHLNGPHRPYNMDAEGEDVGADNSTELQQATGSINIVRNYLQRMKDMGVYDDATIIVTSDHGDWAASLGPAEKPASPILLYKQPLSEGGDSSLKYSSEPVSHAEFIPTVLEAMDGDSSEYGITYSEDQPDDRFRDFYNVTSDGRVVIGICRYVIAGDTTDLSNWVPTDDVWAVSNSSIE